METLSDIGSQTQLSPINLLIMKPSAALPPPGDFKEPDLYKFVLSLTLEQNSAFFCGVLMPMEKGAFIN